MTLSCYIGRVKSTLPALRRRNSGRDKMPFTLDPLKKIHDDTEAAVLEIYRVHREEFLNWAVARYEVSRSVAEDIFQDTIISLYDNIRKGKLVTLHSSLKTYIFAIGKYKLLNEKAKAGKMGDIPVWEPAEYDTGHLEILVEEDEQEIFRKKMHLEFSKLCDDCKKVLRLYYFKQLSMDEIAVAMGYKNSNVAKKKKYECFKKLAERLKNN